MTLFLNKNLVFIRGMQFMNSSLERLVKNLTDDEFKFLIQEFGSKKLGLLKQKGAYPYDYMDSFKRFSEERLPYKNFFYSSVKDRTTGDDGEKLDGHIKDEDHLTCKKNWNKFRMKNVVDYHDHHLKKDVLLLADVFEKFIDSCLKFYKLDPCHYFSSPGLSWNAMLKMIKLEKNSNTDMYFFIEKRLKRAISYVYKRLGEANNKYMKNFDLTKPSKFISYLDMNNLYNRGMSGYHSYDRFKWLENANNSDINSIRKKRLIKVDLKYLNELHKLRNFYTLAPEKLAMPYDVLPDYCKNIADKHGIKVGDFKKFIPNLADKTNYVVPYGNLQLYLSLGMKLTKIHKVLKFKQSLWMKLYIDFNTEKRKNATNRFFES